MRLMSLEKLKSNYNFLNLILFDEMLCNVYVECLYYYINSTLNLSMFDVIYNVFNIS